MVKGAESENRGERSSLVLFTSPFLGGWKRELASESKSSWLNERIVMATCAIVE